MNLISRSLPEGHIIKTMILEHGFILAMLDELEDLAQKIINAEPAIGEKCLAQINTLSVNIIAADPHNQREEDILFTRLEEKGITGPPMLLRLEHETMRQMKYKLAEMTSAPVQDWINTANKVTSLIYGMCTTFRQHMHKENNVLYSIALEIITDASQWTDMKKMCDRIGYCSFFPEPGWETTHHSVSI
ncbi:MAG: hemerythrin domain-containing protein [Candidatus Marinimicrobia bacterium]|nr:hemerythrin domain-containing protein [Candidatus Neomarinimicrobiota bacterium]